MSLSDISDSSFFLIASCLASLTRPMRELADPISSSSSVKVSETNNKNISFFKILALITIEKYTYIVFENFPSYTIESNSKTFHF